MDNLTEFERRIMRSLRTALFVALVCQTASAQITVISTERLPLPVNVEWLAPRFGPDGTKLYLTSTGYSGIWEFTRGTSALRQLSADPRAGYGFAISPDGKQIAYRRLKPGSTWRDRQDEVVLVQVPTGKSAVQATGRNLSLPAFAGQVLAYASGQNGIRLNGSVGADERALLGIEGTKIAVLIGGRKELLDPLGNGSYIWPSLSPDGTRIVAYDMSRGMFVCDLNGTVLARLGRHDAPAWSREGKWIVCVDEKDDGHRILSSDLIMISADGTQSVRLTDTPDLLEMNPVCSSTENRIVYNTADGAVMMLTYSGVGR
jgi:Tol biopolymer transport system component